MTTQTTRTTDARSPAQGQGGTASRSPRASRASARRDGTEAESAAVRHLPFALAVVAIVVTAAFVAPETLSSPLFIAGIVVAALTVVLSVVLPWRALPTSVELVLPALDYVVVALCREGSRNTLDAVGILLVFPALWLTHAFRWVGSVCATIVTTVIFSLPFIRIGEAPQHSWEWARLLIFPAIVLLLGIHGNIESNRLESKKRRLELVAAELSTALDRSDERQLLLDSVLDTVDAAVVVVDQHGEEVLVNRVARSINSTAARHDRPNGGPDRIATFHEDRVTPYALEERLALRAARQETVSGELLWIGYPPHQTAWLATVRPVTKDDGSFFRSVIVLHDVTELVAAIAMKESVVDSISHELRTPLTSMIGYLDIMREAAEASEPLDHGLLSRLAVVERNADRLHTLIRDLLAVGKQGLRAVRSNVDLMVVAAQSVAAATPAADARGVSLVVEGATATISADSTRIGQALDNLVSNAIKYGPVGGTVTISVHVDEENGWARLGVSDEGDGIDPVDHDRIFERFYRTPAALAGDAPGAGLGLSIVGAIVRAHHGTVEVASAVGRGTTMTLLLPLRYDGE